MKDYTFLNRSGYFSKLTSAVRSAKRGEKVIVATMDIAPNEPAISRLLSTLHSAAKRGVRVTLLVDAHNFLVDKHGIPGPLFYRKSLEGLHGRFADTAQALKDLKAAGGSYVVTNIPKHRFNPSPVGRSHIKAAVVGSQVYLGGCNLERAGLIDAMVTWDDKAVADTLAGWLERIAESGNTRATFSDVDTETELDHLTRLLLDAGVPGQSLIYDEALQLIDKAQKWIFITCQYFPGGQTAQHLAAAQERGVKVEIVYSHPRPHGSMAPLQHLHQIAQRAAGLPRNFFRGKLDKRAPKLHAKILATERGAMIGSHNYVPQGVSFGTAELALCSFDASFADKLRDFMKKEIASSTKSETKKV